jgi:hypothetical protein
MDMTKYSSNFVKAADVENGPIRRKIAGVVEGKYDKADVIFETGDRLSVNATNNNTLMRLFGSDSDTWVGQEIELFLGEVKYQGTPQPAVRVRLISKSTKAPKSASSALSDDMSDSIPF